ALAVFLGIGLMDSIGWVGGGGGEDDEIAALRSRTLIDRLFQPERFTEASYSAPLAAVSFYGGQPLKYPRRHLPGTDILRRDVVYRARKGIPPAALVRRVTRPSVIPSSLLFGVSAGYFGKRIDDAVFFVMTVLASVPSLLLLIALVMVMGRGTVQVCIALGITGWVHFCRIARGETLKLREAEFV